MATFHPSLEEQEFFATPLYEGEARIRDLLAAKLDDEWHVYVQPHLLNQQPDFLLVHKDHGATVLEVKDWRPGGHRANDGRLEVQDANGDWHWESEDPVLRIHQYKANVAERFLTPPDMARSLYGDVRTTVVLPRWVATEASSVLKAGSALPPKNMEWVEVAGVEVFDDDKSFWAMVHGSSVGKGHGLSQRVYNRFINRLEEPEAVSDQRLSLRLSKGAQNVAKNPKGIPIRRVRGSAGSGKTLALSARAGNLAKEGKSVLILTFNITLANYIQTLVGRWCRQVDADRRHVDIIHIHGFCRDIIEEWDGRVAIDDSRFAPIWTDGEDPEVDTDAVYDNMITRVQMYYEQIGEKLPQYDAVIVDEGQDFKLPWWNFLRQFVVRGGTGEMLLAADTSQDLYGRRSWTDEGPMRGAGFRSRWKTLSGSYRLPVDFVPILRDFADRYIGNDANLPTVPEDHLASAAQKTVRRWVNASHVVEKEIGILVVEEIELMLDHDAGPHPADVTVLVETHKFGERVMNLMEKEKIPTEHIFSTSPEVRQIRKKRFWPGVALLKGSTVHSFKGWESRGIVYLLQSGAGDLGRFVYTALTRLKGDPANRPAFITIINLNPDMDDFKETFERVVDAEEIGELTLEDNVVEERVTGRIASVENGKMTVQLESSGRVVGAAFSAKRQKNWSPAVDDRVQGLLVLDSDDDDDSENYRLEKLKFIGNQLF